MEQCAISPRAEPSKGRLNGEHLECINRARHAFRNFVERLNDRLIFVGNSYVEYYRDGRMALILRCEISLPAEFDMEARFLCKDRLVVGKRVAFIVLKADVSKPHHIEYWDKQLVLIKDVQFVQGPQGTIPSRVGFYDIQNKVDDHGNMRIPGETLLFQSAINGTYELFPLVADWKPCSVVGATGSSGLKNLVIENIQRTFEIVQRVSDDKRASDHIEPRLVDLKSDAIMPFVFLDADGVKVGLSEGLKKFIEVVDVLHGPFNLTS